MYHIFVLSLLPKIKDMNEIWLPIKDYENLYEVSNLGRIRYLKKKGKKGGIFKPVVNPRHKYLQIRLSNDRKLRGFSYHRLVATHFIPNPENLPEVNHIDGDKTNNRVDNLEWCTKAHNRQHAIKNGLWKMTDSHRKAIGDFNKRTKSKTVLQLDKSGNLIKEHTSTDEAAKSVGAAQGNIVNCCNGKKYYKTVKGFVFKYK